MKRYLHLLVIGATIAATAFAVGSQPTAQSAADCGDKSCCPTPCCSK